MKEWSFKMYLKDDLVSAIALSLNLKFSTVPEFPLLESTNASLPIIIYRMFCFQVLASLLYRAARDGSYVNPDKVEEILGVKQSEMMELSKEVTSEPTG